MNISLNYNGKLVKYAKKNRAQQNMTKSEGLLWNCALKNKKMHGYRFQRQKIIQNYILDFYCAELSLAIEVDGLSHEDEKQIDYDEVRKKVIEGKGIKVIRVNALDVLNNLNGVIQRIEVEIEKM